MRAELTVTHSKQPGSRFQIPYSRRKLSWVNVDPLRTSVKRVFIIDIVLLNAKPNRWQNSRIPWNEERGRQRGWKRRYNTVSIIGSHNALLT